MKRGITFSPKCQKRLWSVRSFETAVDGFRNDDVTGHRQDHKRVFLAVQKRRSLADIMVLIIYGTIELCGARTD